MRRILPLILLFLLTSCLTPQPAVDPNGPMAAEDQPASPLSRGLGVFESPLPIPVTSRGLSMADDSQSMSYFLYLAHVVNHVPAPTSTPILRPTPTPVPCNMNPLALEFARLLVTDGAQQRPVLNCSPSLAIAAQRRAEDMARRNYFNHTDPDGVTPNIHAKRAGCALPYGDGNNIESIGAGTPSAAAMFNALMNSPNHRSHMMGELDFFREQTQFAIGMALDESSQYKWYWVIMIGICEGERGIHLN